MSASFDIWKMLAGVAFFLLAMNIMQDALHLLAGRKFKLFLKKQTTSNVKAVTGGAVVTGLLQSSSISNLLVLSMVGASVIKMENALALILGSNLGSTFGNWMVALFGFSFNIEHFALPVVAIAGISMAFTNKESKWMQWIKFLFSLGFLFIALGFMKSGMEEFVKQTDLSVFSHYPVVVFLLLGVFLTAIIQSSSATMALTLSALHTNVITLHAAMAIALGAEIGTTLKLFLAAANGMPDKKRVALGNFLFNLVTVVVLFFLLQPVKLLITESLQIKNNLLALVFFQSLVNLTSIILFFPFLKVLGKFLLHRFRTGEDESFYISKVPVTDTGIALEALENETRNFIDHVMMYSINSFELKADTAQSDPLNKKFQNRTLSEQYTYIKQLHGEMHGFYLKLQNSVTDKSSTERLDQLIAAIRNIMYAAKNISDARQDIVQVRNSSNDIKYGFYLQSRQRLLNFYSQVKCIFNAKNKAGHFEELTTTYNQITKDYPETLKLLYKENLANRVSETEISTLINLNRELYTSFKSILFGLKDYLLTSKESEYFDSLPGFIR